MWYSGTLFPFSGLHCPSFLGIGDIVVSLIEASRDPIFHQSLTGPDLTELNISVNSSLLLPS